MEKKQLRQYVHLPEDMEIGFSERAYQAREERLQFKEREILYHLVESTGFTCCDRSYTSHLATIRVLGYIIRWKYTINEKGEAISEIEPIEDKETQQELRKILRKGIMINVDF
jgi:hypothetical protein